MVSNNSGLKALTLNLFKNLEHLSACTERVDTTLFQGLVVQLDKVCPLHILEIIGVLVKAKTAEPAGDILQKGWVGRVLGRLGAASSPTRGSSTNHVRMIR